MRKFLFAFAIMLATQGQFVHAQQVKVTYPDGTVRYENAAPTPAANSTTVTSGVSCCPCNGGTGPCKPDCAKGKNEPKVESKCPPGTENCKDIPIVVEGKLDESIIDEKFYEECKPYKAKVPVPKIEIKKTEKCEFKKYTYKVDCCEVTVCVPCRTCTSESKKCVIKEKSDVDHELRVCKRRDGTYDVYVIGVPGMPKEWLLYMEANKDEINKDLGIMIP